LAKIPETMEAVRDMVAGDLGKEMEKYPLRFASSAYFGAPPHPKKEFVVSSGSASLVRLKSQPYIVTCSHVLQGYRDWLEKDSACIFQIGDCKLDPVAQLVDESSRLDVAVIGLTEQQVQEVAGVESSFGSHFVVPPGWPPAPVVEGDFVAFGGFPGELRRAISFRELSFGSYSSGASRVTSAGDTYIICQFERDHWVKHGHEPEPSTIRGMSGGPAFALRKSPGTGIMTYEFIGHIYEFSESFELLYIRLANVIGEDGRIRPLT
jgi:hypothetical protein